MAFSTSHVQASPVQARLSRRGSADCGCSSEKSGSRCWIGSAHESTSHGLACRADGVKVAAVGGGHVSRRDVSHVAAVRDLSCMATSTSASAAAAAATDVEAALTLGNDFDVLPTIDISAFAGCDLSDIPHLIANNNDAAAAVQKLHRACVDAGFLYLTGHGVSQTLIDDVREVSHEFFALPEEEKSKIALEKSPYFRGYQSVGQNITKGRPDWHEAIDLYKAFDPSHPLVLSGKPLHGPNQWPSSPHRFRNTMERYVEAMNNLGRLVMRLMAASLHTPPDAFEHDRAGDPFWVLRVIGYPPIPASASQAGGFSCGEHTDYGLLTFVNQDEGITALQVKNRRGQWVAAPPVRGAFVVNIGDMLKVWTNGVYQSTPHRVLNASSKYRVSVPFFYEPNFDAVVAPLQECVDLSGRPPSFDAVVYGDHLIRKVSTNFV